MSSIIHTTIEEKIRGKSAQYFQQSGVSGIQCFPSSGPQNLSAEKKTPGFDNVDGEFYQIYK